MLDSLSPKQIQENLRTSAQQVWLAGLGAVTSIEEQGTQVFDQLVARGRELERRRRDEVEEKLKTASDEVEATVEELGSRLDQQVASTLQKLGVPTRSQVRDLTRRVERLSAMIAGLETAEETPAETASGQEQRRVYHVTPHDDGWKVQAEGSERASRLAETKEEAVNVGRELAKSHEPSQLVVHRLDGTIQTHYTYGDPEAAAS